MAQQTKTYLLQESSMWSDSGEDEIQAFAVIEAERLGQYYSNQGGYEYPNYCWSLREVRKFRTLPEAEAFIEGLTSSRGPFLFGDVFRHPTFTGSANGPGKYPLAEDGGDLLFTIVSPPVK